MQQGLPPGPPTQGRPPGPPGRGGLPSPDGVGPNLLGDLRGIPEEDDRMWALLAHGAGMLVPVLGPVIIWFMKREESEFVAYHAAQATYWGIITLVGATLISVVTCGAGTVFLPGFWLAAAWVGLQAKEGSWTGYWLVHPYGYGGKLF